MKILKDKKYTALLFLKRYGFIALFIIVLFVPNMLIVNAAVNVTTGIENPIGKDYDTIPKFIEAVINVVLIVGIPLLVLAIIYAGFLFVKAQGNSGELEIAKRTLMYTIIGGVLLLGAFVIAKAIGQTVEEIKSTT